MGTTAEKLVYLEETKADIRAALVEKGMDVPESMPFREYAEKIREISSGSTGKESTFQKLMTGKITERLI